MYTASDQTGGCPGAVVIVVGPHISISPLVTPGGHSGHWAGGSPPAVDVPPPGPGHTGLKLGSAVGLLTRG